MCQLDRGTAGRAGRRFDGKAAGSPKGAYIDIESLLGRSEDLRPEVERFVGELLGEQHMMATMLGGNPGEGDMRGVGGRPVNAERLVCKILQQSLPGDGSPVRDVDCNRQIEVLIEADLRPEAAAGFLIPSTARQRE